MEQLKLGDWTLTWLNGGVTHLDGGAMFGVVPKPLWSKKYPVNEKNQIELRTDPILVQADGKNFLIEGGIGSGRLTEKQLRNYGVHEESKVEQDLEALGLQPEDIDAVLMTHLHFDHGTGLIKNTDHGEEPTFPNAVIHTSDVEWEEMKTPNIRSQNTYWQQNWKAIEDKVEPFHQELEVIPGLKMIMTGGHSTGHSIIKMENGGETLLHMADLMPTHAHSPELWVMAYDDYPLDSIAGKETWFAHGRKENAWYTFYHDYKYRAVKWNEENEIVESVERNTD
ncbi:glyoxylase-like metal-dependent hydrolase (beta-lactamase superfamily II) [Salsuginibacillus halophilus]|uniref:Glyoxylase-like metal-dependent hydrolase (Beta-lactamase superfamily II) n=1 Tax=Salsuginibacillus halophilus TaxID=517424 RepID=A0A2P8HE96_9BACI|nr:MBL fold metallo-hydrolase [Salsuginibacillus halophilus]PSL44534.1 glyoxylase-like metal-dependent hydrolase (beta-lactamase superfamily II) [Salsuginibacillus halophilus]